MTNDERLANEMRHAWWRGTHEAPDPMSFAPPPWDELAPVTRERWLRIAAAARTEIGRQEREHADAVSDMVCG